jgi:16S rRNA (cytosine1402-N4)-methyltransferase
LGLGAAEVLGNDRDKETLDRYQATGKYASDSRLKLHHGTFAEFYTFAKEKGLKGNLDGILLDLGVSTRQLLDEKRGFSFRGAGPLDMRMDQSRGETLKDWLSQQSEETIAHALFEYGEISKGKILAREIKKALQAGNLNTTEDLASLVHGGGKKHPATQLFMALRMAVNRELWEIENSLLSLLELLKPGGRMGVITFHSVEDRLVKRIFKRAAGQCVCGEMICRCELQSLITWVNKKPLIPSREEQRDNRRSRSAKLRCVEKID